jgi:signal transduction histidine kinase
MAFAPNTYGYMFESASVALCAADSGGRVLAVNSALERLLGCGPSEWVGRPLADCLRQAIVDPAQALCWTVALSEALSLGKTTYLDLPGEFRTGFPDGHLESVAGIVVSCQLGAGQRGTLLVLLDRSLMQSMAGARTRFFAAVSHEFGTPVSNIVSAIDLLSRHLDAGNAQQQKLIQVAQAELARLRRLMDQFLAASSPQKSSPPLARSVVTLRPVLQQVAHVFGLRDTGRRVVASLPSDLPFVWGDADIVGEILSNLVENALRYSPPGTDVTLTAHERDQDVLICVRDQGPGIAAEDREQLFEPFYRGRQGRAGAAGQGLGLAIALSLAEQLGGRLWYEDPGAAGPCFCFTLPRAETALAEED